MNLEALFDNVIISPDEVGDKSYGNIIIPDMGNDIPYTGTVLSVGPGRYEFGKFIEPIVKKGDRVILPKIGPVKFEFNRKEYFIISEKNILSIIKD